MTNEIVPLVGRGTFCSYIIHRMHAPANGVDKALRETDDYHAEATLKKAFSADE